MTELIYKDECYEIIGAAMAVHQALGCGFSEKVYQDALAIEFGMRGIPFQKEKLLSVTYKGNTLKHSFYADFICYDKIIVELKAMVELIPECQAQVLNYLHVSEFKIGLLINFGRQSLEYKRIIN